MKETKSASSTFEYILWVSFQYITSSIQLQTRCAKIQSSTFPSVELELQNNFEMKIGRLNSEAKSQARYRAFANTLQSVPPEAPPAITTTSSSVQTDSAPPTYSATISRIIQFPPLNISTLEITPISRNLSI
jgi:hypothetical protein